MMLRSFLFALAVGAAAYAAEDVAAAEDAAAAAADVDVVPKVGGGGGEAPYDLSSDSTALATADSKPRLPGGGRFTKTVDDKKIEQVGAWRPSGARLARAAPRSPLDARSSLSPRARRTGQTLRTTSGTRTPLSGSARSLRSTRCARRPRRIARARARPPAPPPPHHLAVAQVPFDIDKLAAAGPSGMAKMKETMLASEASSGNTQMAFLTLKDGVAETDEERAKLGSQWAALLVTNAVKISYHMIGGNELLITEEQGRIMEIKDFVLQQPEVAKFRWKVRRAGGRNMDGRTRRSARNCAFFCGALPALPLVYPRRARRRLPRAGHGLLSHPDSEPGARSHAEAQGG